MIKRYSVDSIEKIWSENNKLEKWWEIEKAVCEGWNKIGVINEKDLKKITSAKIDINVDRMLEIEKSTKHDVVAFTRMISEQLGEEKKWVHLGLTSTDIVDTAQNTLIKESNEILIKIIEKICKTLEQKAIQYKNQLIMGRTHGIAGEPTSLGLKFLLWYEEWKRHLCRLELAKSQIEVVKISGSMGNYAHVEPQIEKHVADKMGLQIDPINTQVTQRDRHAFLFGIFANIGSTLEKIATEIRLFQQTEIGEVAEGFSKGQKGSSSMPHKKNPIGSENICGISRMIEANFYVAIQNNPLWHERDISHSSNERIILPETYHLLVYSINRLNDIIDNLSINKQKIDEHINDCRNVFFSQVIMTEIIKTKNVSREEIYDFIQKSTIECLETKQDFKAILVKNGIENYISKQEFTRLFELNYFLRNIDFIYERVLNENGK